ncbi:MAG: hypothetical protein ABSF03_30850 [Streptosporangiaceae bacterium]|jgi:hypothetical protein
MLVRAKDPGLEPEDIADAGVTSYHATDKRITIVIVGPDARERIAGLRRQLAGIVRNWGWTITGDLSWSAAAGSAGAAAGERVIVRGDPLDAAARG